MGPWTQWKMRLKSSLSQRFFGTDFSNGGLMRPWPSATAFVRPSCSGQHPEVLPNDQKRTVRWQFLLIRWGFRQGEMPWRRGSNGELRWRQKVACAQMATIEVSHSFTGFLGTKLLTKKWVTNSAAGHCPKSKPEGASTWKVAAMLLSLLSKPGDLIPPNFKKEIGNPMVSTRFLHFKTWQHIIFLGFPSPNFRLNIAQRTHLATGSSSRTNGSQPRYVQSVFLFLDVFGTSTPRRN